MGRVGRSRIVSFKILHTLWVFRTCIYILVYEIKIVTNIVMGLKIWCQVGGGVTPFSKLPYSRDFSNMRFKSCLFFLLFLKRFTHFLKISKTLFAIQNGVLKFAFETYVNRVLLKIILALTNFTSNRYSVNNFTQRFKQGFTKGFSYDFTLDFAKVFF